MTNLNAIKKWKYHYFESASYRTEEYAKFEGTLKRWYKQLCTNNGWELIKYIPTHFECGCFIRGKNGKMIHILGNDVRNGNYPNCRGWWKICYRFVMNENDYRGESNRWTDFDDLEANLQRLLNN